MARINFNLDGDTSAEFTGGAGSLQIKSVTGAGINLERYDPYAKTWDLSDGPFTAAKSYMTLPTETSYRYRLNAPAGVTATGYVDFV